MAAFNDWYSGSGAGTAASSFNPIVAGVTSGLSMLDNYLNRKQQKKQAEADREAQRRQFIAAIMGEAGNLAGDELDDTSSRDIAYLNSTQLNPVKQQQDIFRSAAIGRLAGQGAPTTGPGGVSNMADFSGVASQYLSDPALAGAAARFYGAAGAISPNAPAADLSSMGFGAAGSSLQGGLNSQIVAARAAREALRQKQRDALNAALYSVTQGDPQATSSASMAAQIAGIGGQGGYFGPPRAPGPSGSDIDYFNRTSLG